jgi:hypothetical protein
MFPEICSRPVHCMLHTVRLRTYSPQSKILVRNWTNVKTRPHCMTHTTPIPALPTYGIHTFICRYACPKAIRKIKKESWSCSSNDDDVVLCICIVGKDAAFSSSKSR